MWLQEEENIMKSIMESIMESIMKSSSKAKRVICLIVGAAVSFSAMMFVTKLVINLDTVDFTNIMEELAVALDLIMVIVAGVVGYCLLWLSDKYLGEQRKEEKE